MIDAIIVEDELLNRNNLQRLIQKYCSEVFIVATAESAYEAIPLINKHHPQLIFLDIQMPGKDGFEMLREFEKIDFEIIFVTAYSDYGIQAIKFSAIDYLLKPIDIHDLKSAVNKAIERIKQKSENQNLQNLLHYLKYNDKADHRIAITSLKEMRLVPVTDIVRCESENSYTFFYLGNEEKILSTSPILYYEELLSGYGFLRCHQSHLVNKKYVKSFIKNDGYFLLMNNNVMIPVSRQKKNKVRSALLSIG
ncbi:MAG TPA: LytTR family DNA-binding domain-containing protein [Niabella sp.]|nr:LytTR family DNA-binding domain-containing protein [Niabella sp.]